jgi:hypothetical protein
MNDLMLSELRRFRWIGLAAAGANLLLLVLLNRIDDLLQASYFHGLLLLIAMACGLALALFQVGSYRKASRWAWLIHRPLASSRIFAAIFLAALTLLSVVLLLPMLLLLITTDVFTTRVVDLRHYLAPPYVLAFALMAWLAGAHACVSRSPVAIAVLFAPLLLALHLISVIELLLPVALALAWLGWITLKGFRANREAPIEGNATLLATALPLQFGLYAICVAVLRFLLVAGGILVGVDPLNTEYPPEGGLIQTQRSEPAAEIALGLAGSDDPRAESWRAQLPLLDAERVSPWLQRFPTRQQFSNLDLPTSWFDKDRKILWTFSHDDMLFHGRNPESGVAKGLSGRKGLADRTPFGRVPVTTADGDILTPDALYGRSSDSGAIAQRLALAPGEQFTNTPKRLFNRTLLLTNRRLLALREDQHSPADVKPLTTDWEIDLPRGPQHLEFVSMAELMDGWLVSFVYGDGGRQIGVSRFTRLIDPWQQVVYIDADGATTVVAERSIDPDFPALQRSYWWISPALDVLSALPEATLDKGLTWPLEIDLLPQPRPLLVAALLLLALSTAIGWWWLRDAHIDRRRRLIWLASCLLIGLPALLSLMLLEPRGERR